jgi:transposase
VNESLREHYRKLLGLEKPWEVVSVDLAMEAQRVEIRLSHGKGGRVCCPDCDSECGIHDEAPERQWRHLDTMQFETIIKARTPRANCSDCGVKTIAVPWAGKHSRFTLLFEAFAIEVLKSSASISSACLLLKLDWSAADRIMSRAVDRGLARRGDEAVDKLGIDEKSFRSGHRYVSTLNDLTAGRVIEVVEGRDEQSALKLFESLSVAQRDKVEAIALDM